MARPKKNSGYDLGSTPEELNIYCRKTDLVFYLAGVNRSKEQSEFMEENFANSQYGKLKQAREELFFSIWAGNWDKGCRLSLSEFDGT